MDKGVGGIGRPQVFGAGVSLGMFAGILIGSLVTLWLGEAAMDLVHRMVDRVSGRRLRRSRNCLIASPSGITPPLKQCGK